MERWLIDYPHHSLPMPDARYRRALERYRRFKARWPDRRPTYYEGRGVWM